MGDHTIGNNQERQGRDTPKPKADIRLKVLLKSIWQRHTARSQSLPSELQARGRASKGPSGTASLCANAKTVPRDIPARGSVQHHRLPDGTKFWQEQPPLPHACPSAGAPSGCSQQPFSSERLCCSAPASVLPGEAPAERPDPLLQASLAGFTPG